MNYCEYSHGALKGLFTHPRSLHISASEKLIKKNVTTGIERKKTSFQSIIIFSQLWRRYI